MPDHISDAYRKMLSSKNEDEIAARDQMVQVLLEQRRANDWDLSQLVEYSDTLFRKMIYGKNNDRRTRRIVAMVMKRLSELLGVAE